MPIWESQNKPKHIHIRIRRIQGLLPSCKTFRKKFLCDPGPELPRGWLAGRFGRVEVLRGGLLNCFVGGRGGWGRGRGVWDLRLLFADQICRWIGMPLA